MYSLSLSTLLLLRNITDASPLIDRRAVKMDMGEHCTLQSCLVLTFLPVNCPYCRDRYCQAHFLPLQHGCKAPGAAEADRTLSDTEILKRIRRANARRREVQAAGPGAEPITATTKAEEEEEEPIRLPCQSAGCKRFSLYVDATVHQKSERGAMSISTLDGGHERRPFTHAAPRCDRCRGFFCMG